MTPDQVAQAFARFQAANPQPTSDLEYTNPFTLLVAVVLSAQATDAGVNRATRDLFARADTPAAMLALGEDGVREAIKTIGLFNAKAKNVAALSAILVERHGGAVPQTLEALTALPGVGRKTANVVLNVAFGQPTLAVDTHIFRVAHRLRLADGKTADAVERQLLARVPEPFLTHAHHWLILHGRYVCRARRPECWRCAIADLCPFEPKSADPATAPKTKATAPKATAPKAKATAPKAKAPKAKARAGGLADPAGAAPAVAAGTPPDGRQGRRRRGGTATPTAG